MDYHRADHISDAEAERINAEVGAYVTRRRLSQQYQRENFRCSAHPGTVNARSVHTRRWHTSRIHCAGMCATAEILALILLR